MTHPPLIVGLDESTDLALVGGKGLNLATLIAAGLPVPGGFVVTTAAWRARHEPAVGEAIRERYRAMGSPPVAARSSATAEDLADASMAGQYATVLGIRGEDALVEAVERCWASIDTPQTRTYFAEHGIDLNQVAMAVVVQRLVPADVAGVLFTANPRTGVADEMVVEASWGLGEAVVSGLVQPDIVTLRHADGSVVESVVADKDTWLPPGATEPCPVEEARRREPCLSPEHVGKLWQLGRRCQEHFGHPQDIEWAIAGGELFLLQSRPITSLGETDACEVVARAAQAKLHQLMGEGRGPWALHNLAETLPHPTPLTWSIIGRFMSGRGGFGEMYRQAGFEPSERVCRDGFLTLVAGRLYMDTSLAAEMLFEDYPFAYDVAQLRANPDARQAPPTLPRGGLLARWRGARRIARAAERIRALAADFDADFVGRRVPEFAAWCAEEGARDLAALTNDELVAAWRERERRVMDDFGPASLLPTLIAEMAVADLRACLDELFWDEDPDALVDLLASAHEPDATVRGSMELYEVATGERTLEAWLADHGHRAPGEFDLATPRWREQPDALAAMVERLAGGSDPRAIHRRHLAEAAQRLDALRRDLGAKDRDALDGAVALARRYMPFRENAKHELMRGYALLRAVAVEAGRRLEIGDDVFLLTAEEMADALAGGAVPERAIAERRATRRAERRLRLPRVIDGEGVDSLGHPELPEGGAQLSAFPVSAGVATGPARLVRTVEEAGELGTGYILVCPSTDPAWTPLFVNAAGLVLERGGSLSHGAIVAREMGLPAVVLPDATRALTEGETVTVDGKSGAVLRGGAEAAAPAEADPSDIRIPRALTPPAAGRRERGAARLRNAAFALWGIYLAAAFLLPDGWLYDPSLAALDLLLWPLVPALGKALTVAAIGAALALLTMAGQRVLADHKRLQEAKARSTALRLEAAALPEDSPRRGAMMRLANAVQARLLGAALVPLGLLLGPLVMTFVWLPARVDPAAWSPPPGTSATIVANVDSSKARSVELRVPPPLTIDAASGNPRVVPDVRKALEELRDGWPTRKDFSDLPAVIEERAAADPRGTLRDLEGYLARGVPPVAVAWTVRVPDGTEGRFAVEVLADDGSTLGASIVLGDHHPPAEREAVAADPEGLASVRIAYPPRERPAILWAPLAPFGRPDWDPGWLVIYLLAYLPAMFLCRWLLRIP